MESIFQQGSSLKNHTYPGLVMSNWIYEYHASLRQTPGMHHINHRYPSQRSTQADPASEISFYHAMISGQLSMGSAEQTMCIPASAKRWKATSA